MFNVRDIIGVLATTTAHTEETLQSVAESDKFAMNLHLAIYEAEDPQPYLVALTVDVPVQLRLLKNLCDSIGDVLVTSD